MSTVTPTPVITWSMHDLGTREGRGHPWPSPSCRQHATPPVLLPHRPCGPEGAGLVTRAPKRSGEGVRGSKTSCRRTGGHPRSWRHPDHRVVGQEPGGSRQRRSPARPWSRSAVSHTPAVCHAHHPAPARPRPGTRLRVTGLACAAPSPDPSPSTRGPRVWLPRAAPELVGIIHTVASEDDTLPPGAGGNPPIVTVPWLWGSTRQG